MSSIDPAGRLAALLGAQVAALRQRARPQAGARPPREATVQQREAAPQDAATLAALRVRALDPDDPQRPRKAFRIFLEATLLAELGTSLANDPAFSTMVDDIHRQMEDDPALAPLLDEAARQLLQSA